MKRPVLREKETLYTLIQKRKKLLEPVIFAKKEYLIYTGIRIFNSVEGMLTVRLIAKVIDYLPIQKRSGIYLCIGAFALIKLIAKLLQIPSNYLNTLLDSRTSEGIAKRYLKRYISLDMSRVELIGTGKIIGIYNKGIGSRVDFLQDIIEIIGKAGAILMGWIMIFYSVAWRQSLLFFVCFLLSIKTIWRGMNALNSIRKESREVGLEINRQEAKIFMSKMEILQQNKIDEEVSYFQRLFRKQNNLRTENIRKKVRREVLGNSIMDVVMIIFMIFAVKAVVNGQYQLSSFIIATTLLWRILAYVRDVRNIMRSYFWVMISIEKLWDVFDNTPTISWLYEGAKFHYTSESPIEISNLTFAYHAGNEKKPVFENFSMTIPGAQKTAFVGPSGGGKSTLIKLIAGMLRPQEGQIQIDHQFLPTDSKHTKEKNQNSIVALQSYYAQIGYLSQEPSIFDGTIYQNLVYALDKEPDDLFLRKIIAQAQCDFIREFELGIHTEIGERGVRLSGGQKQRLAIAKIMLKNPAIILLDEPTSALDSFNEERISLALHELFKGKTVIVIAHRLQTVKEADHIFFIDEGKIKESGTHESLVQMQGLYAQMLELQTGF